MQQIINIRTLSVFIHRTGITSCDWYFLASAFGSVCVLTRSQKREFAAVRLGGRWNKNLFVKLGAWNARVKKKKMSEGGIIGHIFAQYIIAPGGGRGHDISCPLLTSVLHLLPPITAVSFGLESQRRVSLNNENNRHGPTTTPPPFSLFLRNRMLWIWHQRWVKGHVHYLSSIKTIFLNKTAHETTMRANGMQQTTYWLLGFFHPSGSSSVVKIPDDHYVDHWTTNHFPFY